MGHPMWLAALMDRYLPPVNDTIPEGAAQLPQSPPARL